MGFKQCETCKEYHFTDRKCKPIFYFKHDDWGEEWQEIRAVGFEDAADNFAKYYNEDADSHSPLMNNTGEVLISDGETEKKFRVSAETDIRYSSEEIK